MVHQYKLNGYNIVIDSNSGNIHVVDPVAYDVIGMYQDNSKEKIKEVVCNRHAVKEEEVEEIFSDIATLQR